MPVVLPSYSAVDRTLPTGLHPYLALLPGAARSPALRRIARGGDPGLLLARAKVRVEDRQGYAYVDVDTPCVVLAEWYYRRGDPLDLYLDLLHELTHLRQLSEGLDLWDERFEYVDRPTEIEGYAVAVEEGRRLGMDPGAVLRHLSNPWMTEDDVHRLLGHIDALLRVP